MEMHPCRYSGQVAAFGYDPKTEELRIRFHAGGTYAYKAVPQAVFMAFLHARSKGGFVNHAIKGHYDFERLEEEPE